MGPVRRKKRGRVHGLNHVMSLKRKMVFGTGNENSVVCSLFRSSLSLPALIFRFHPRLYVQSSLLLPVLASISKSLTLHDRLPSSTACGANLRQSFANHVGSSSRNVLMHTLGSSLLQLLGSYSSNLSMFLCAPATTLTASSFAW